MAEYLDQIIESGIDINPIMLYDLTPDEISKLVTGITRKTKQEEQNMNMRVGTIVAAIYNVNRNPKKRHKPYTWKDIFGDPQEEKHKKTPDELKNTCKNICMALGGRINVA